MRSLLVVLGASLALLAVAASGASAQKTGFTLDRFTLAPSPEDGLGLQLPSTLGPKRLAVRFVLGYQRESLVSGVPGGGEVAIVRDQLTAQVALALGLGERFEIYALLPATLYQHGEEPRGSGLMFDEIKAGGVGDLQLGGSAHLLGEREHGLQLSLNAALLLPSGSPAALASDGEVGARGSLSAALVLAPVTFALQAGAAYRPKRVLGFISSGSEALMRVGAYVPVAQRWRLLAELDSATRLGDGQTFEKESTPVELLAGGEYIAPSGVRVGIGGGPGLTLATATPLVRLLATIGYAGPRDEPPPPATLLDRDHDGVLDVTDGCPDDPEDFNQFEDNDGCPDATRDGDADGIPDRSDGCPGQAEDRDGVDDADGCPDADVDPDKDGIVGASDQCPNEPETMNGVADQDGCPDAVPPPPPPVPTAVPAAPVDLPAAATFARKSAKLRPGALLKLAKLREAMAAHPELHVSLEGHSSADGTAEFNQSLSEQRAQAVKDWLVAHGIAAERVEAHGFGASRPLEEGDTESARSSNRRVEFKAVQ